MYNWVLAQPDNQDTYKQFITQFHAQFLDSGKMLRACNKVRNLKMSWPHIDQYIIDFKQLVEDAEMQNSTKITPNASNSSSWVYPTLFLTLCLK